MYLYLDVTMCLGTVCLCFRLGGDFVVHSLIPASYIDVHVIQFSISLFMCVTEKIILCLASVRKLSKYLYD